MNSLIGKSNEAKHSQCECDKILTNDIGDYFVEKISVMKRSFESESTNNSDFIQDFPIRGFNKFEPVDEIEVFVECEHNKLLK